MNKVTIVSFYISTCLVFLWLFSLLAADCCSSPSLSLSRARSLHSLNFFSPHFQSYRFSPYFYVSAPRLFAFARRFADASSLPYTCFVGERATADRRRCVFQLLFYISVLPTSIHKLRNESLHFSSFRFKHSLWAVRFSGSDFNFFLYLASISLLFFQQFNFCETIALLPWRSGHLFAAGQILFFLAQRHNRLTHKEQRERHTQLVFSQSEIQFREI